MPSFSYIAIDAQNQKVSGTITAGDRGEALRQLDRKGLRPTRLQDSAAPAATPKSKRAPKAQPAPKAKGQKKSPALAKPRQKARQPRATEDESGRLKLKIAEVILFTEELADMLAAGLACLLARLS